MKILLSAPACLAAAICLAAPAFAQSLVTYDTIGAWTVLVDPTVGNGCLINAEFEDGSDVRIGFDVEAGNGYLMAMNDRWGEIVPDQTYPIQMDVDGSIYDGEGIGIYIDDMPGVDIVFDNVDFLMDVALRQTLTLLHDGSPVMAIDLTDTHAALEAAIACQEAQQ